jgi:tRNA threonylcarbamoyladenosine biosynthesis protein TsaE
MAAQTLERAEIVRDLPDLDATARLAGDLAPLLRPGDVVALAGDLGSGKTTFARALIAALAGRFGVPREEVPSPTFTLVQTYDFPGLAVWHFDLYRLKDPAEALELGIEDAFSGAVSLIEWPERLGALLPARRLELRFEFAGADARVVRLTGTGDWTARMKPLALHD